MSEKTIILDSKSISQKMSRITRQVIENNYKDKTIILAGINGNGFKFAQEIHQEIQNHGLLQSEVCEVKINKENPNDGNTKLDFDESKVANQVVLVVDDVVNSGKTLCFAVKHVLGLDAKSIQTAVLVDRKHRKFPIRANYLGIELSTTLQEHVDVEFQGKQATAYLI